MGFDYAEAMTQLSKRGGNQSGFLAAAGVSLLDGRASGGDGRLCAPGWQNGRFPCEGIVCDIPLA